MTETTPRPRPPAATQAAATDPTEVRIRRARSSDLEDLADLASRTWQDTFGSSLEPDDLAAELRTRRSPDFFRAALQETTILVAERSGALLGYVQFGPVDIPELAAAEDDRQLHRLYVDRPAQGRGLGRQLLYAALAHRDMVTARRVYLCVWEQNTRAVRLYEGVGFRRVGVTTYSIGDKLIGEDLVLCLYRGAREG